MKNIESSKNGIQILRSLVAEWNSLPEIASENDVSSVINSVINKFKTIKIEAPAGGYKECMNIIGDIKEPHPKYSSYIFFETGERLAIPFLIFLGRYNIGAYYMDIENDPIAALDSYYQANECWFDVMSEQYFFGNISLPHIKLQEWDVAINYLHRAIDIARSENDEKSVGMYYQNLGVAYRGQYDLNQTRRCYKLALDVSEKLQDEYLHIRMNNLAAVEKDIELKKLNVENKRFILHARPEEPDKSAFDFSDNYERIIFPDRDLYECPFFINQWVRSYSGNTYFIKSGIGCGAVGIVLHVSDSEESTPQFAMKALVPNHRFKLSEIQLERFNREINILKKVNHPNVAQLLDQGKAFNRIHYYIMPFYGNNLRSSINSSRWLPQSFIIECVKGIWDGIFHLHELGIIHRDIKPENIMIDDNEKAVISDFGISAIKDDDLTQLTKSNYKLGSFFYMSPEQRHSPHSVTEKADYYSLGLVMYELITGSLLLRQDVSQTLNDSLTNWDTNTKNLIINLIINLVNEDVNERPNKLNILRILDELNTK